MPEPENLELWRDKVFEVYDEVRGHDEAYEVMFEGNEVTVLPGVFSPRYFTDSFWFAKQLRDLIGTSSLLEVGTGTGIIGLACALEGSEVVATDINPGAVENAELNAGRHDVDMDVREGSIFEPISEDESFECIFWNHPFNKWDEEVDDMLLKAGFDRDYAHLREYVSEGHKYLATSGRFLLGTGNYADTQTIQQIASNNDYELELVRDTTVQMSEEIEGEIDLENKYLIYEFR